jgi:hypothetical protein
MTKTLEVSLKVGLKGVDPVISTTYLTLADKMGYRGTLLALNRLESYAFSVGCQDPASTLETLKRYLATQSTFYNRNKHNYFLDCRFDGDRHAEGVAVDTLESLALHAARWAKVEESQDLDSQQGSNRVILRSVPVYRSEVLVEDIDPISKESLARKLESELSTFSVSVSELGIRWYLALGVGSEGEAKDVTRAIVVTESRDRGLLLNPNHQRYKLLSLSQMSFSHG